MTLTNDKTILSSNRAPNTDRRITVKQELISCHEPQMRLDTKTDWQTAIRDVTDLILWGCGLEKATQVRLLNLAPGNPLVDMVPLRRNVLQPWSRSKSILCHANSSSFAFRFLLLTYCLFGLLLEPDNGKCTFLRNVACRPSTIRCHSGRNIRLFRPSRGSQVNKEKRSVWRHCHTQVSAAKESHYADLCREVVCIKVKRKHFSLCLIN